MLPPVDPELLPDELEPVLPPVDPELLPDELEPVLPPAGPVLPPVDPELLPDEPVLPPEDLPPPAEDTAADAFPALKVSWAMLAQPRIATRTAAVDEALRRELIMACLGCD
ncbi:hypothetical protein DYH55_21325 [Methylovirgula sp. 4M-Z18]|nr:hypothetical protein DYH55_21325 [Methylovirgula sp. 4M-Z18]